MSQGFGMTEAETAEILAVLNVIGSETPAELVGSGWYETYAGNVIWTFRGWTVAVFNDCMSWDYLDAVTAPDGRRWDFDEMADRVRYWTPAMDERRWCFTPAALAGWPSLESDPPADVTVERLEEIARPFREALARDKETTLPLAGDMGDAAMTAKSDLVTFDSMMKDLFPLPGQPVKEWVLRARAARAELERTGKRVRVEPHLDNTGAPCREVGPASLVDDLVQHDCCYTCSWQGERVERIDSGALPLVLDGADWKKYAAYSYAPIWAGWLGMWRDIAELRERAFRADEILFGGGR